MLLAPILGAYEEVVFIIADRLQVYNKVMRSSEPSSLSIVLRDFHANQQHVEQRRRWLNKVRNRLDPNRSGSKWTVIGIDDVSDTQCFQIFRNVMLAYYTIHEFRNSVKLAAEDYVVRRQDCYPIDIKRRLSIAYILEELAISIRIRVLFEIQDEYYDGRQAPVIMKMYEGDYPISVFDIAGKQENQSNKFLFFRPSEASGGLPWEEYSSR